MKIMAVIVATIWLSVVLAAPAKSTEPSILVIGDSNVYKPRLMFPSNVTVDGEVGIDTADPSWPSRIEAALPVDVVVVHLGTNDANDSDVAPLMADSIDSVMDAIPADVPVVWNLVRRQSLPRHLVSMVNTAISNAPHPNLTVADLPTFMDGHPKWIRPGGLHFTGRGYRHMVQFDVSNATSALEKGRLMGPSRT